MQQTPSVVDYAERMWRRREATLSAVIAEELALAEPSDEIRVHARSALDIQLLAITRPDPLATIEAGFDVLDHGWLRHEHQSRT
jgi:hypothetical protein